LTKIWISYFWPKQKSHFFALKVHFFGCYKKNKRRIEECPTTLNWLPNFQSIGIKTWKFLTFRIFSQKKSMHPLTKNAKIGQTKQRAPFIRANCFFLYFWAKKGEVLPFYLAFEPPKWFWRRLEAFCLNVFFINFLILVDWLMLG